MVTEIKDKAMLSQIIALDKLLFNESSYSEADFERMFIDENYTFIAYVDVEVLGYAIIFHNYDYEEIFKIGVKHECRRQGFGGQLIKFMQNKYDKIYLEVNSNNVNAISFYKKHNFIQNGLRKNYYGKDNDGVLMEWCSDF